MAEERLIDDDKDRKYKIIKNENGEEELVILPSDGTEEDEEQTVFEVGEQLSDDEEAAILSPEEYAERERQRKIRLEKAREKLDEVRAAIADGEYEKAQYALEEIACDAPESGEVYQLKLIAESRSFTDYTRLDECLEAANGVKKYCDGGQKGELAEMAGGLLSLIEKTKAEAEELSAENERKKEERRPVFNERFKKAAKFFAISTAVFGALLIVAAVFASMIYAREDGINVVLTAVFGGLAGVAFIEFLIAAHKIWVARRNVKLNEDNSRTKIGREYEKKRVLLEKLEAIDGAIRESDDISR